MPTSNFLEFTQVQYLILLIMIDRTKEKRTTTRGNTTLTLHPPEGKRTGYEEKA